MSEDYTTNDTRPSELLVTDSELQQLSGYKQPSRIADWLISNGIPFFSEKKAGGRPRVVRKSLQAIATTKLATPNLEPDHSWMKRS